MNVSKLLYLLSSSVRQLSPSAFSCPNCGSSRNVTVDKKFIVTALRRCEQCRLMFRVPADNPSANERFYQAAYHEGFTTEVPNDENLQQLLRTGFEGSAKSYSYYIAVLRGLGLSRSARIFDYGCSWGYGSWQLMHAGYEVEACELSRPRAEFAQRKLGVNCRIDICDQLFRELAEHPFDCFFSAHVLEHLPCPSKVIDWACSIVKPGGYFVAFTPNGSEAFRRQSPDSWHLLWGQVHPNLIDSEFYLQAFPHSQIYLDTSPANLNAVSDFRNGREIGQPVLSGDELLCIAKL